MDRRPWRRIFAGLGVLSAGCLLVSCTASGPVAVTTATTARSSVGISTLIHRATSDTTLRDGYFSDPYPISGSMNPEGPKGVTYSGTFPELLTCQKPVKPGCFTASKITVDFSTDLQSHITAAGSSVHSTKAHHIYHEPDGSWDMVLTSEITHGNATWNVIFHASPEDTNMNGSGTAIPTRWAADSVLTGSLTSKTQANYDGKLYRADNHLYLIYSGLVDKHGPQFGVLAQPMRSPSQPASARPIVLLKPSTAEGGMNSENRFSPTQKSAFKLVETGNLSQINGKFVMIYAVGAFDRPDYKIGVAYSDTFVPKAGSDGYRKVLQRDSSGVWGPAGHQEVRYLLQSEERAWPNYSKAAVSAPGVGSILRSDKGQNRLFFAGYRPTEHLGDDGKYTAAHRTPFYADLHIRMPADISVTKATNPQLQTWITVGK